MNIRESPDTCVMSQNENRDEILFKQALLQQSPAARAAFLDGACQGEPALRARLDLLLEGHFKAQGFLDTLPGTGSPRRLLGPSGEPSQKVGDLIGRYKLLEQIGEGGCGVVYLAEQSEPVRRRVALKIIKLGMDTRQVIARFEAERQALAMMDHPNISKVHDAGATETGRPYFVMELVRGVKITDYCDQKNLSTRERLALFGQVCHAIQHAHQKGIIHRDIKPSNVLVTVNDGVAVPKVIDFGIAKATTGERLTDKTVFTAFNQFIGTPAYTSPEQAEITSLDVDTRSDIYSLGVLLYELLTGKTPFDSRELLQAGLEEMRRTLREKEPERPSTRISTLGADEQTTTAKRRGLDAPKLVNLLRGDLDWIVMKCLEKDRARRYETANGLASDVKRHLDNEPVLARPPSNAYRIQKFARRNKLAFAAGAAVILALSLGLGISMWSLVKERHARQRAATEAAKSQQVAQFLTEMLRGVGPSVSSGRDTKMLREILDKTAIRVGQELKDQPEVQAELRKTLGSVYFEIGEYERAEAALLESLAVRRKLFGNKHPAVASSLNSLAYAFCFQGRLVEAEAVAREALAVCKELFGNEHPNVANALDTLATVTWHEGKRDEAETAEREALAMTRKLLGYENADVAQMMDNLAAMVCSQGRLSEAENLAREGLRMRKDLLGKEEQRFSWQEGLGAARSKSPTLEPVASAWEVAISINNLGGILGHEGELTQAESLLGEALTMRRKLAGDNNVLVSKSLANLLEVLERQGKLGVSEELARECLAICEKTSPDNWLIFSSQSVLGGSLLAQKRFSEAEPLLLAGYEGLKQRRAYDLVQCEPYLQRALQRLTLLYEATGRSEQAGQWRAETTKWRRQEVAKYRKAADVGDIGARSVLARLLATCEAAEIRDGPTAVAFAEAAVAATKRKNPNILDTLAATYAETGQFQKAVAIQKEVLAINSNPTLAKDFESHLKSYESGKPWRE